MIDEKKYLKKLIGELKHFFTIEEDDRADAAFELEDKWGNDDEFDEKDNSGISKETQEIVSGLGLLHHYEDNPEEHDYMLKQILIDVENRLAILDKEGQEQKFGGRVEEGERADDEDEDEEEEKFIV